MIYPWFMPLMFLIAGISARYSLQKRRPTQYMAERFLRVGLPFVSGVLIINPFLSYCADVFNNGYSGGYLSHYVVFFTKWTDLSGYDGGFGVSHLWFLLYLLIISLAALPVFLLAKRFPRFMEWKKWPFALILVLGAMQAHADDWLNIGGKSLAQYFILFLIGMFALSHEEVQEKLERFRLVFLISALVAGTGYIFSLHREWSGFANDMPYYLYGYLATLTLFGLGRRHFDTQNRMLLYMAKSSQLYYIFHYPILTAAAFLLMPHIISIPLQICMFVIVTFVQTLLLSEAVRRIPIVRALFGMKSPNRRL
jgi:surface polysaccharide O-acyltransferase-like enzyme